MVTKQTNGQDNGGAKRDRTADLLRARQALSQLSYGPILDTYLSEFYSSQGILWRSIACYASHKITQRWIKFGGSGQT